MAKRALILAFILSAWYALVGTCELLVAEMYPIDRNGESLDRARTFSPN
jgi:hypothetical protein